MVTGLKWTTVTSNEVEQAKYRLEASVFNVEAKKAKEDLKRCKFPVVTLCGTTGIATAYHRLRFRRVFVEKSELAIYQPSQISDTKPKPELFISHLTKTNIDSLRVKHNQILMTCSGTIGKATLVSKTLDNKIFSHDLLRITANDPIDIGLIYAYFKTHTGLLVLTTNNYGAVIQHIEPEHLDNLQIPYPSEKIRKSINEKILKSFDLRDKSNDLLDEAEQLLIKALKLRPLEKFRPQFFNSEYEVQNYSVSLNQIDERFDGSYHIPIVNSIIDCLLDNAEKILPIGHKEITKAVLHPERFKRVYVADGDGVPFFGGKGLTSIDPTNKKSISSTKHSKRIPGLVLHENMLLASRSGTIGKVNIVPKHWQGWIATDDLLRIIPVSNEIAGYMYVWLISEYGRILIERFVYGSVVDHIEINHISKVPIPLLKNKELMKKINDLALEANNLRSEAYYLEQAAIEEVNKKVIFA